MAAQSIPQKRNSLMQQAAIKVFPVLKQERTQTFIIVVLTFVALIIFGLFAINPTIATIIQLRKQLSDNKLVQSKLQEKITNLSILQGKYNQIQPDLALVLAAVPDSPRIPEFIGKVQTLAAKNNLSVITIQSNPLTLTNQASQKASSISFSFTVQGTREDVLKFITAFMNFDRVTTVDKILISTTSTQTGTATQALVEGKAIYKPL